MALTFNPPLWDNACMLKFVYCVRRRPDITPDAFRKYWLENHGPLVRKYAQALRAKRYVQSHTLDNPQLNAAAQQPRGTKAAYDGITEVWWDSPADLAAALQTTEGQQANGILAQDEGRFCDLPNCSVFFTEEHTIF
ncbi:MAG TPA: EthD domain-containing protein [Candidatus Dormibacteraeota bacterium]|nr:EthD domain-containing protein [Candidatus Dormibacteraeota bacterium]